MIDFAHPLFLLLLAVLPVWLALAMRRSLAGLTPAQRRACFAWRLLLLALLVLALAGVRLHRSSDKLAVLFLVDHSASIGADAQKAAREYVAASLAHQRGRDTAGVIGFAEQAAIWQTPAARVRLAEKWPEFPAEARDATNVQKALDFASGSFAPDAAKRIVLLSDGNDTVGGAAGRLAERGVELYTVPIRNARQPEVLVESLDAPQRAKAGEPFDLVAKVRSNTETRATVKLYQNGFLVARQDHVELKPGLTDVPFPNLKGDGGFVACEVEAVLPPADDTLAENNRAQATVSVRGEPRVLLVDRDETKLAPLAGALRAEKINVETRGPRGLPATLEDLQGFDLFLLSDVPALDLSRAQMELYRGWVQDFGGGFVMLGGENSFGVGGYYRTPIEGMLPVRMEHADRVETPTVAMLIVLDRSGSMAAPVQGQTKMSLADQGAVYALNVLGPKDLLGVMAVDTRVHTIVPLARPENKAALEAKIMSITAGGGGIYIYTSLVEAFQQLRDVNAKIKHVLLFSDAADAEEKAAGDMADGARGGGTALDIATAMLANKITTSVVALGAETDKDTAFLKQLAERGSGRFYLTDDALSLPQIFSTETMRVAQSSLVEEPFNAVPIARAPMLEGIDWTQAPLLLGYNATKPKPTADLLLATERGEPLLATWRYGLGQAAAFTSDAKARWSSEWLGWPGFGKFWTQLVRGLMRKSEQSGFQVTTSESGRELTLRIDAVAPDGSFRNDLPVAVNCLLPNGETRTETARQDAPGSYTASFDLPAEGTSIFSISAGAGGGTAAEKNADSYVFGHTRSYPKEFLTTATDEDALRRWAAATTGGKFAPDASEVFAPSQKAAAERLDLTPWFLSLALLLFPLDIWLRRRTWKAAA